MDERQIAEVRDTASRLMHWYYCDNQPEAVRGLFADNALSISAGNGDEEYIHIRETINRLHFHSAHIAPPCAIEEEQYSVQELSPDTWLCVGQMCLDTAPDSADSIRARLRVSLIFQKIENRLLCVHIHCSHPCTDNEGGEKRFQDEIEKRILELEQEVLQQEHQMDVVMSSIPGGMKCSLYDKDYTYVYVTPEAAAPFGYTSEEFLAMSGGTAAGAIYPPDRQTALETVGNLIQKNNGVYTAKYRIPCKDGSLKWVLDSGRKAEQPDGKTLIYSLYLDVTREEESAQEIRRQQELLQSIYDTIPCGILRFTRKDGCHTLISHNHAAQELLNYRNPENFLADWDTIGIAGSVLQEDRAALLQSTETLHHPGDHSEIIYRARRPDGGVRWLSGVNTLLSSQDGEDILQRTMFDITDRYLLQEQLSREREMYRVAMESSSDVMYEYNVDEDTFVTYAPCPSENGGVRVSTIPHYQQALQERKFIHPDDIPKVLDNLRQCRAERMELRMIPPNGDMYEWYRATSKQLSGQGRGQRVVGTLRNIQIEKETMLANESALHIHQSALQALSDVYDSIFYIDLPNDQYYCVRLPDAAMDKVDVPRAGHYRQIMSIYLSACISPLDMPRLMPCSDPQYLSERLQENQHLDFEYRHKQEHDGPIWMRLEFQVVSTENGKPQNVIGTFRNVTESRSLELERQLEEQQARKALEDAYQTANHANQAKSEFLSKMSHDMRTPMNAIMGMTAIARRNIENRVQLEDCLEKIQLSSRHLLNLINDVLDMSKIESGSVSLNESVFHLHQLLQETEEIIRPDIEKERHTFVIDAPPLQHETVLGDSMRIQQILLNLLSNSIKYTPKGGHITLTLREAESFSNAVSRFLFVVEDDGIGMTPKFRERLFLPFERAEDSRVSRIQGTGLGMAITKNLVNLMNGSIQVESQLNKGTRITVELNLKPTADTAQPSEPELEELSFADGTRVLLVEDNSLNREIARYLLESMNLTVDEAENGEEAVTKFQALAPGTYRLILMDIQMPIMTGYQATRAIRESGRPDAKSIPIIALTANAFAEDVNRARQAGMNAHLAKPLTPEALEKAMRTWIPSSGQNHKGGSAAAGDFSGSGK